MDKYTTDLWEGGRISLDDILNTLLIFCALRIQKESISVNCDNREDFAELVGLGIDAKREARLRQVGVEEPAWRYLEM